MSHSLFKFLKFIFLRESFHICGALKNIVNKSLFTIFSFKKRFPSKTFYILGALKNFVNKSLLTIFYFLLVKENHILEFNPNK